jgi:YegS/Rv2252/BmrU family lipid kinase
MTKYKIILNPTSGSGTGARSEPRLIAELEHAGLDYHLVHTERRGHAIELARQAVVDGFDVIVAAGGDGTVNEVINGLVQAEAEGQPARAVGVLCVGRGNDFAHGAGIPADLAEACQVLGRNQRRRIDIGRVTGGLFPQGRYFGNCVGVGFDAVTTIEVSKMPHWGGFLSFFIAVLRTIFLYFKAPRVRVEYDDKTLTQACLMVSVMNGQRLGGGFWLAPEGKPDDGLFDLCIARQVSRLRIFTLIPHFMKGDQAGEKEITMGQAAHIRITAEEGVLPAQTDGEIICVDGRQLEIELLHRRLSVVTAVKG